MCARLDRAKFYENNKESVRAESMKYHYLNRDRILSRQKQHYEINKDVLNAKAAKYREANRDVAVARSREWRANHPGRNEKNVKEWMKNNPMKAREYSNARRTRKIGAPGRYTPSDIALLLTRQSERCQYCCTKLVGKFHVDHIISLARGGTNYPSNICIACPSCNHRKSKSSGEEFSLRLLS